MSGLLAVDLRLLVSLLICWVATPIAAAAAAGVCLFSTLLAPPGSALDHLMRGMTAIAPGALRLAGSGPPGWENNDAILLLTLAVYLAVYSAIALAGLKRVLRLERHPPQGWLRACAFYLGAIPLLAIALDWGYPLLLMALPALSIGYWVKR